MTIVEHTTPKIIAYDMSTMTDEQFAEARQRGLGGSDIAAALGMAKFKSPWELYHRKRGELPATDKNEPMYWGTALEPVIRARFQEDDPDRVVENPDAMYQHRDQEWAIANPDGLIDHDGVLEIKTASHWVAQEWDDGNVPDDYMIQGQYYCEILDREYIVFAVLIGGNDYRTVRFERDRQIGAKLIERGAAFWKQIQEGRPPAPIHSDKVADKYPLHIDGEIMAATVQDLDLFHQATALREQEKALKEELDGVKNQIRDAMGDAEFAMDGDRVLATWKTNKKGARVLSIKD